QIHGADTVVRAHEVELPVQCEVAEMNGAEFSKSDHAAQRLIVLGRIDAGLRPEARTIAVRHPSALEWRLNDLRGRRCHTPIQTGHRNPVARLGDRVLRLSVELPITAL